MADRFADLPRDTAECPVDRTLQVVGGRWATLIVRELLFNIPAVKDDSGRIRHTRGVTPAPGLYMLGLTWQHTRTSALLGWVGNDAAYLAARIASYKRTPV